MGRTFAIIGVNPEKEANGQYGAPHVIVAINTAQRFIVKSAPPQSLGALVKTAEHVVEGPPPSGGLYFNKDSPSGGRLISVVKGSTFDDVVEIKPFVDWMRTAKTEAMSAKTSDLQTFYATELGRRVYLRPAPYTVTTFVEIYVDDPDDMALAADVMSLPDEWKEWVCLCAAQMILLNANNFDKSKEVQAMMVGWSTVFRSQYGMNPPAIQAPVAAGKEV